MVAGLFDVVTAFRHHDNRGVSLITFLYRFGYNPLFDDLNACRVCKNHSATVALMDFHLLWSEGKGGIVG